MAESTTRTPTPSQTNQHNSKNGSSTERSSGTGSGESSTNTPSAKKKKGGGLGNHDTASKSGLAGVFASLCGGKKAKNAFDEEPLSSRHTGSRPITGVSQHSGSKASPAAPVTTKQVSPDIEVTTTKRLSIGETDTFKTTSATIRLPMTSERVTDPAENGTQIVNQTEINSVHQRPGLDGHGIQTSQTDIAKDSTGNGHDVAGSERASGNLAPALIGVTAMGVGAASITSGSGGPHIPQGQGEESSDAGENDNIVNGATQKLNNLHLPNDVIVSAGHPLPLEETEGMTSAAVQPPGSGPTFVPATGPHAHHHHLTPHISRAVTPISNTPSRSHSQNVANHAADTTANNDISDDSFLSDSTSSNGRSSVPVAVHPSQNGVGLGILSNSTDNVTNNQTYRNASAVDDDANEEADQDDTNMYADGLDADDDFMDEEDRLIRQGGIGIPTGPMIPSADFIVPVEIESQTHNVYVIKRPGVDMFLKAMGEIYEVVVFTASLSKYADPVLDMLDIHKVVKHRLFRESCYNHKGNYVKDLSQLGREIHTSIIIDNSPASYIFHPNNAVPVSTWFNDPHDTELTDLSPFLADLATVDDVRGVLDGQL
ncbi:hypothetical protein QFC21_000221 [Naganishia friedmannii]|uniref:Uncharacterized protein n=1 Tax=Naganishia friedmannii TaxID=89922 RepID=A0ACC2WCP0_9TREE|nr:hypothetical protein QFC21_000221 [Naganishia friedmannii]